MALKVPEKFLGDDNEIRPELLDEEANRIASVLEKAKISTHQVRKFYNEVKSYQKRLENEGYSKIKPLVIMLKSKAKYAANSKKTGMDVFYEFIDQSIEVIKKNSSSEDIERKNFDAFCLFFEAVYGFANLRNS